MDRSQAIWLWSGSTSTEFGGDWGGNSQPTVLGGASLAKGIGQLNFSDSEPYKQLRAKAAAFLREWADALEGK